MSAVVVVVVVVVVMAPGMTGVVVIGRGGVEGHE